MGDTDRVSADVPGRTWARLRRSAGDRQPVAFDATDLDEVPEPAARWLRRALPPGVPLATAAELAMVGHIRIGSRWMPFRAAQILRAGVGFVWRATVGGRLMRFVGADVFDPEVAQLEFRLHGVIPVAHAAGPDVARSAAGRLAAETVAWLPQAATPQLGARWRPLSDRRAVVGLPVGDATVDVEICVSENGALTEISLQRWNSSTRPPTEEPFGGPVDGELVADDGVRISRSGNVGWGHGTSAEATGRFFRYEVRRVEWITID